ncbi:MAG: class I SAM-dependent methyltransferase [Solirubrobacterales bacterium]|nr:class I SAM-dependent methyltransferase [Solirubrobacterales bacterium]
MTPSSKFPYPPFDLATRVAKLPSNDFAGFIHYEMAGRELRQALIDLLPDRYELAGRRVLDFGSGSGRTLRHFASEAETGGDYWGIDIDAPSVTWMQQNLCPPFNARVCGTAPPVAFESESFDLIWALSVFTHLTEHSAEWLLELHRVLKPDGLMIASYMGRWNSETLAHEPWDETRIGMNVLQHDRPWDRGGPVVLMSDWWIEEHWGRAFDLVDRRPRVFNQTWQLLRKRDVSITPDELMAPASCDEREMRALRHNLIQLQREATRLRDEVEAWQENVAEVQRSLSWRMTAPLRRARGVIGRSD